jgi:hypothetical protein
VLSKQPHKVYVGANPVGPISGNGTLSCQFNRAQYFIDPVPGATQYIWTNSFGWSIAEDYGTSVVFNATGPQLTGSVTVTAINGCGLPNKSRTIQVIRSNPASVSIGGPSVVPPGNRDYFDVNGQGSNYAWTIPTNWTVVQGGNSFSNYVVLRAPANDSRVGTLRVSYINVCGYNYSATKTISTQTLDESRIAVNVKDELEPENNNAFNSIVYPNPTQDYIYINNYNEINYNLLIANSLGQEVLRVTNLEKDNKVSIKHLPNGIYFLRLYNSKESKNGKIIIKK